MLVRGRLDDCAAELLRGRMLMRPQVVRAVRKLCAVGRHVPALEVFDKQLTLFDILGGRGR